MEGALVLMLALVYLLSFQLRGIACCKAEDRLITNPFGIMLEDC